MLFVRRGIASGTCERRRRAIVASSLSSSPRNLWPEPLPVFTRSDKRFYHLSRNVVTIKLIELVQPELVAGIVGVLRIIRVAAQIPKILGQHKGTVGFGIVQIRIFGHLPQSFRARDQVAGVGGPIE